MKKPYINKYSKIGKFEIWIIDGNYVRTNMDEEFTNFGCHYRFKFIPKNELWIDKEKSPGEEIYYIDNMLTFIKYFKKGKSFNKAYDLGDKKEKKERQKAFLAKNLKRIMKKNRKIPKKIYIKLIHIKIKNFKLPNIKVWLVDGEIVRDLFFIEFTEGGHDKVYKFIPDGEVWLDNDLFPKERKFVLLHELHERNLMSNGLNYERAHAKSSHLEFFCRHHPKKLNILLKKEFKKIKDC